MPTQLKILIIEDSEEDAELLVLELERAELLFQADRVQTADDLRLALERGPWDLVVSDYSLPSLDAPAALQMVREADPDLPFIVVSGTIGEDVAVDLLHAGANDYVLKSSLARLPSAIQREIRERDARRAQRKAELNVQQLAAIVQASDDAIMGLTLDGTITTWNPGAELIYGYTAEEAIGRSKAMLIPPDLVDELPSLLRQARMDLRIKHFETARIRKDGKRIDVSISVSPVKNMDGVVVGASTIARDISERKRAEQERRETEARFNAILDNAPAIFTVKDLEGRYLFLNRQFEKTWHVRREDVLGKTNFDFIATDSATAAAVADSAVIEAGLSHTYEVTVPLPDGERTFLCLKFPLFDLNGVIYAIGAVAADISENKLAAAALKETEEQFRATFEQAAVGIVHNTITGCWLQVNQRFCDIVGYTREEILERTFEDITHPDDYQLDFEKLRRMLAGNLQSYSMEKRYRHKDSSIIWIHLTVSLVRGSSGEPKYFISVIEDITNQKRIEAQLSHAQKLDGIGRLAGGIAHDFNNLLTAILGFTEMAAERVTHDAETSEFLANTLHAGERAAALTRQLLSFARRQLIEPRIIDLNVLLLQLDKLLRRIIGEDIELTMLPEVPLWEVRADPSQVEQVIVNLAVNARDAMPKGGKLTIETRSIVLDEAYAGKNAEVVPGEYVMLAVSDTGMGMTEEVKRHIFEPFFTTKGPGEGTGLGLATCYGIVKQSGGHLWFYSEPGQGTAFKIYLPRAHGPAEVTQENSRRLIGGEETILLVEDEALVREFAVRTLKDRGYTVLIAGNGVEALAVEAAYGGTINLLFTDVVMPQMGGKALADRVVLERPGIKVLYASGYTDQAITHHGSLDEGVKFLQKPYTPSSLSRKVREALDVIAE
jgi:PAS domain S-box-containing protein